MDVVRLLLWFDECAGRPAPRRVTGPQLAAPHHAKSATGRARRALPSLPLAVEKLPESRWAALPWAARRARASGQGAPSNTRLKLAAPGSQGRIPFVIDNLVRRSLSAIR